MKYKRLKIALILPDGRIHKIHFPLFGFSRSFREAPLTATHLAALIPDKFNADITIIDESVGQKIQYDKKYDLVGISVMTGTSTRAYEISAKFREEGVTVVLGGVHVTLLPDEAAQNADSIITGFAEKSWPLLLNDFVDGKLKHRYESNDASMNNLPIPKRELQDSFRYNVPNTVFMTRGCLGKCDFCSVPAAGFGWNKRPINDIINELKIIKSKLFSISDVHLTQDVEYAKELFSAMIPLKKKWGALASTRVIDDPELLELMQKAGCTFLLIGFESINQDSMKSIGKGHNVVDQYKKIVSILHDHSILIQGCFIFGFDNDKKDVFESTVDFIHDAGVDIPRFALYTPYPKTGAYSRLEKENRILHRNWYYYDTQHVVIQPKYMSPQELDDGFLWAYKKTFKTLPVLSRSSRSSAPIITVVGNLAYHLYINRLKKDHNRFPTHIDTTLRNGIS